MEILSLLTLGDFCGTILAPTVGEITKLNIFVDAAMLELC